MIAQIRGKCSQIMADGQIVIEISGLGFAVRTAMMPKIGSEVKLFIYENIREDTYDLYGFATEEELLIFKQIVSISGIGPKIGLAILKNGPTAELVQAIENNRVAYFEAISGVGRKMAQKIILELRSKIGYQSDLDTLAADSFKDLASALDSLGYRAREYRPIMQKMPTDLVRLQDQITWALRELRK